MGDLDRRKHDVDIIERVIGAIRETGTSDGRTRVVELNVPSVGGSSRPILELTVGIDDTDHRRPKA
jgi:hypothetical protein